MRHGPAPPPKAGGHAPHRRRSQTRRGLILLAGLIVVLTFAAHWPAIAAGFVWDDDINVTDNPHLRNAGGLSNMWFRLGSTNIYAPLTFTTLWVEYQLWGTNSAGYHIVNIAFHAACALLLWAFLRRVAVEGAWLAAAIVAVHPVFVESVAWVTELRNVQSAVFCLLCLLAYVRYAALDRHVARFAEPGRFTYALALVLFGAALLSKPAAVALPGVILAVIWWRRGTLRRNDVVAVAPMFAMSLLVGLVAMHVDATYSGGSGPAWQMSVIERILVAARALWFYAGKVAWPHPLMSIYPRWDVSVTTWWQYLYPLAAGATLVALWVLRKRIGRGPLAATVSFAVLAAPTTGLFNFSYHLYAFVADHYQYHAAPALIALAAAGVARLRGAIRPGWPARAFHVACGAVLLVLAVLSTQHARAFEDEKARCLDTLDKNPAAWVAMNNLAVALNAEGRHEEAVGWYQRALKVYPVYAEGHSNLGVALFALGRAAEAIDHYQEALRIWPGYSAAHNNLGTALASIGNVEEAIRHYREALRVNPGYAEAHNNLATLLASTGDLQGAIREHQEAVRIEPEYARAHHDLGVTLASAGRLREAIQAHEQALRIEPRNARSRSDLASALAADGRLQDAVREYREAIRIEPGLAEAHNGLGLALFSGGRLLEATQRLEEALRINPGYAEAHNNLGTVLAATGDLEGAIRHYREAVQHKPDYAEAFVNLGKALFSEGDLANAIRQLEEAVRLQDDSPEAHNLLGISLAQAGRLDEAIKHFERALAIKGDYAAARENLDRARTLKRAPVP